MKHSKHSFIRAALLGAAACLPWVAAVAAGEANPVFSGYKSIRDFGVTPTNTSAVNKAALQSAIDWAAPRGAALFVEPSDEPYPMDGGLVLKLNVSLVGVHGPVGRGTRHPDKPQPVGSVFRIEDDTQSFIIVESATQLRGLQFWYPRQTLDNPAKIIEYPPTIQVSRAVLRGFRFIWRSGLDGGAERVRRWTPKWQR